MFKQSQSRRSFSTEKREHHRSFSGLDSSAKLVEQKRSIKRNEQWIFL